MKIIEKILYSVILCGVAFHTTSCQHEDEELQSVSNQIVFSDSDDTRALKETFEIGDSFSVWGYSRLGDNVLSHQTEFAGVKVEKKSAAVWEYDNPRYWISARTYDFYAFYPYGLGEEVSEDGTLTLENFDLSSNQQDVMTARETDIVCSLADGVVPDPVAFAFEHRLAYVELCAKEEVSSYGGGTVTVTRVSFYGMSASATYTETPAGEASWTPAATLTTSSVPFLADNRHTQLASVTAAQPTSLFQNGILVFPGTITGNYAFRIEYEIDFGGSTTTHETILRPATVAQVVPAWETGKKYRYTFTVIDQDRIIFDIPTITTWGQDNEDIFIVE